MPGSRPTQVERELLDRLIDNSHREFADWVTAVTENIVGLAKENIVRNGQVDTGNMLNSVHVEDGPTDLEKYAAVGADYGLVQEVGSGSLGEATGPHRPDITYSSGITGQPARPFLAPAVEEMREPYYAGIRSIMETAETPKL